MEKEKLIIRKTFKIIPIRRKSWVGIFLILYEINLIYSLTYMYMYAIINIEDEGRGKSPNKKQGGYSNEKI